MAVAPAIFGLVLGFAAAVWACSEGYSLSAMIGTYMVSGILGVLTGAAVPLVRRPRREHAQEAQEA